MQVSLLRHGIAADRPAGKGSSDCERPLTRRGRKRLEAIAEAMQALGLEFDLVLTSPFRRARQTAELVAARLGISSRVLLCPHLAIPPASDRLVAHLAKLRPRPASVLLVGHEPHLSTFTSLLIAGTPHAGITFKKGGLATLEVARLRHGRCATLQWLLTPRQMRQMI